MAITRAEKEQVVDQLTADFDRLKLAVLVDYRGLTVAEIQELRRNLQEQGINFRVTKNTLLKIAAKQSSKLAKIDPAIFTGPMALAVGFDDETAPARAIYQYSKTHEALEIVGALSDSGEALSVSEVKSLATLPTRDQLYGQLVSVLAGPIRGLVTVTGGNLNALLNIFNALSTKS